MKLVKCGKIVVASLCMMATLAGAAMPALAISPAGCTSLAQIEEMNDDEEAQVQALKAAIAKVNVKYDEVEQYWTMEAPHFKDLNKRKSCGLSPVVCVYNDANDIAFYEQFSYIGTSKIDIDEIVIRAGDEKYTYTCDYDNSGLGYDTKMGRWFAIATFDMEADEIDWLREMLSAENIIMRFTGVDYTQYDYTWTADDRQAVTDMVNLYDLLVAASPEVRARALRG